MRGGISNGYKVFILYVFFTYIPQFFIKLAFLDKYAEVYRGGETSLLLVAGFILVFVFFIFIFDKCFQHSLLQTDFFEKNSPVLSLISLTLIVLNLLVSIYFWLNFNISFRHTTRLSDAGFLAEVMLFLRFYCMAYVFYTLSMMINGVAWQKKFSRRLVLILCGCILTTNSALDFPLLVIILYILWKKNKISINTPFNTFSILKYGFLFSVVVPATIFMGYANKWGFDRAYLYFQNVDFINLLSAVLLRISSSFAALLNAFSSYLFNIKLQMSNIYNSLHIFIFRLGLVFHFNVPAGELTSVSRANFLLLFKTYLPKAGATPGLLASVFLMPIFPINIFIVMAYTVFVITLVNMSVGKKMDVLKSLIMLYFIFPLFENPLEYLTIIDPVFFYFMCVIMFSIVVSNKLRYAEGKEA